MTVKIDLLDIDPQLAIPEIEAGNYEEWNCSEAVLNLANKIESQIVTGGVCYGCHKPVSRRLVTKAGESLRDWHQMFITLAIDDLIFDLNELFGEPVQRLREQIEELITIADTLETLDSENEESGAKG